MDSGKAERDRRNILNIGNAHSVNSVYRNFSVSTEQTGIEHVAGLNDEERDRGATDVGGLGSVAVAKGLKMMVANVRDLKSSMKYEELQLLAEESEFDIVAITESWANSSVMDAELALDGFRMFRKDRERDVEQMGGGVLLYIRNNIVVSELNEYRDRKCEAVWVRANGVKGRRICIGVCYRSPSANDEENDALLKMIRSVAEKEKSLLLVGDFNYPRINWEELDVSGDEEAFLDIIEDNFLCQHVTQATRGTNILDLVISSEKELVSKLSIGPSIGGSDHSSVEFLLNLELHGREQPSLGLDYRKADIAAISKELGGIDWNERFREKDANGMWMKFVMVSRHSLQHSSMRR